MPSKIKLNRPLLSRSRIPIRDRAHASEIAHGITFGELFKPGGTVEGFADWLFLHRKTFNGPNPLQQARVYVNSYRATRRRGVDFDAECRQRASEKERVEERARTIFEANLDAIKAYWTETPVGPDISLAVAELCLGRGLRFAASPDGESLPESPPSWVLEWLLKLLEEFGGPDYSLHQYDWMLMSSEDYFRQHIAERGSAASPPLLRLPLRRSALRAP